MSLYIGALGLETFDDAIEDASNTLVKRIVADINYTSNYVLTTSNILVTRINDTSNVLVQRITDEVGHTSNYADRLDLRIKVLEGTEGTEGDISLGIPPIPSTGGFATAAAIAALTAASYLGGVSVLSMILSLEIEVDSNNTATNTALTGKQETLTSANTIGVFNTPDDFVVNGAKIELTKNTSNYVERINGELNTSDTALGVRVDNTSNYVERINTELNTSDTALGVRVDNTSNYVSTYKPTTAGTADTANAITATNLLSTLYTADFLVLNDKIRINKTLEPLGYYQINIFAPANLTWTSTFYNYSDRTRAYDRIIRITPCVSDEIHTGALFRVFSKSCFFLRDSQNPATILPPKCVWGSFVQLPMHTAVLLKQQICQLAHGRRTQFHGVCISASAARILPVTFHRGHVITSSPG